MSAVGVVGLGVLGSAVAANLAKGERRVLGFDLDASRMAAVEAAGVERAVSVAAMAHEAEVLITCLALPAALDAVAGEIAAAAPEGRIVLEISTFPVAVKEAARDRVAEAGVAMLDAPVSGNRIQALAGGLTAFVSGDEAAYEKTKALIEAFTRRAVYVGAFGAGMKTKFCGNILNLVHNVAAAEVMVLAMKSGLDPKAFHDALKGSASSSGMFDVRGALMAEQDYTREGMNFMAPMKDRVYITEHAADLACPLPLYHTALQYYYAAIAQGRFDQDASSVCEVLADLARAARPDERPPKPVEP